MEVAGLDPREPVDAVENRAALLFAGMLEGNPFEAVLLELEDEYALEKIRPNFTID